MTIKPGAAEITEDNNRLIRQAFAKYNGWILFYGIRINI
jgi:hypothetical protein